MPTLLLPLIFILSLVCGESFAETSKCCSCRERATSIIRLTRAAVGSDCRAKAGPFSMFSQCRELEVVGKTCSFHRVDYNPVAGENICVRNPVFFLEDGKKKELVQVAHAPNPCELMTITPKESEGFEMARPVSEFLTSDIGAMPSEESGSRSPARAALRVVQDAYWTCGRDPSDSGQCKATHYKGLDVVAIYVKPISNGSYGCTPSICSNLFDSIFAPLNLRYVQGTP